MLLYLASAPFFSFPVLKIAVNYKCSLNVSSDPERQVGMRGDRTPRSSLSSPLSISLLPPPPLPPLSLSVLGDSLGVHVRPRWESDVPGIRMRIIIIFLLFFLRPGGGKGGEPWETDEK